MSYIDEMKKKLSELKESELGTAARRCAREYKKTVSKSVERLLSGEGAKKLADGAREMVSELRSDVDSVMERDPAARSKAEVILLYSGLHAVAAYRVAHRLNNSGHPFSARLVSQTARFFTGIEIHPGATIGRGLFIDHGSGVVIGETAQIGDNCTLYQGVTLGGTGKHTGKRHPTLGNNVMVGAGAKVLGPFSIGDNSKIAAGAVVLDEVPADSTAVGIPAHVVRREGVRVEETGSDLDQVNIPDPIEQELVKLRDRISVLEELVGDAGANVRASGTEDEAEPSPAPSGGERESGAEGHFDEYIADMREGVSADTEDDGFQASDFGDTDLLDTEPFEADSDGDAR